MAARRVRRETVGGAEEAAYVDVRGELAEFRGRRELSEAEADEIVRRLRSGETMRSIAARLGVDRRQVYACGAASGRRLLTATEVEDAAALYVGGMSLAGVGERFEVFGGDHPVSADRAQGAYLSSARPLGCRVVVLRRSCRRPHRYLLNHGRCGLPTTA